MNKLDKFTKEELQDIVNSCVSLRELAYKLGYTAKGNNNDTIHRKLNELKIDTSHFKRCGRDKITRNPENIFIKDSTASQKVLREHYLKGDYTPYECSICHLPPYWNGKPLTLTLDHINGINNDDRLENLRWVCPNCDRQLPTFGFKNFKNKTE